MAIIRNAANTLKKGRVGETTYYISKGQQVARQSRNDSNYGETARRTELQQNRRVLWANLVQFYKISARWMPKAFESRRPGQTDYNKFMAVNVPTARIPLTKAEAEASACVIDAFLVSQGSLPSVEVSAMVDSWKTNLFVGNLTIGATTTVADLTAALLANNANLNVGMQLSFVMYQQTIDPLGTPRANCRCYEMTLDLNSSDLVYDHIPALGCSTVDGAIGTSSDVPTGGFAWILSELYNGSLRVSTQLLVNNNASVIAQYNTTSRLRQAAESYGIDVEVILNPDTTVAQSLEPAARYIVSVTNDQAYAANSYIGSVSKFSVGQSFITLSDIGDLTVDRVRMLSSYNSYFTATIAGVEGNDILITFSNIPTQSEATVAAFEVTLSDATVLVIPFATSSSGGDMG